MDTKVGHQVTTQAQSRAAREVVEREHPEFADGGQRLVYDEDGFLNDYQVAVGLHLPQARRWADRAAMIADFRARRFG